MRVQAHNDLYITLFDNESGVYGVRKQSGAVKLRLDLKHMTATQVHRDSHSPPTLAPFAGDVEQLPDHDDFVGWGARPYISEYSPSGQLLYDAHFVGANASYRAYLLPWRGQPDPAVSPPSLAVASSRHGLVVYASWNGATDVSSWRVLGGTYPDGAASRRRRRAAPVLRRRSQLGGTRTSPCRRSTPAGTCLGSPRIFFRAPPSSRAIKSTDWTDPQKSSLFLLKVSGRMADRGKRGGTEKQESAGTEALGALRLVRRWAGAEPIDASLASRESAASPSVADVLIIDGMGTGGLS